MRTLGVGCVIILLLVCSSAPVGAQYYSSHVQRSDGSPSRGHSHPSTVSRSHSHPHSYGPPFSYGHSHDIQLTAYPYHSGGRYSGVSFGRTIGFSIGPRYGYLPYIPQPTQLVPNAPPVTAPPIIVPLAFGDTEPKPKSSSPAARMKSLEYQVRGDQRMRDQKWAEARAAYASAVSAAPDRAEAHLRLGLCFVVVKRFDSSIRELKRAVTLDHAIARTGKRMDELLGIGNLAVRNSVLSQLSEWVKDDLQSADRLFLLGAVLHLMNDGRSRDYLEAALQMNSQGDTSHITYFLNPPASPANEPVAAVPTSLPKLNDQPAPLSAGPTSNAGVPLHDLPVPLSDTPVPMPVGLSGTP
ncbi:tetratricopeptide repeat protein [Schlesneria paludicola]|uniref:tetratricopeptide repeat protein n=1 Tax=Schlesneria paludicola TaxID=360056 RepID=UPI0012F85635|nr:tetratricopeptide repeat protein [Schlesneria paludicola]